MIFGLIIHQLLDLCAFWQQMNLCFWHCQGVSLPSCQIVKAPVSKCGPPCAFWGKSDSYRFSTRIYIPFNEKDVSIFLLQYLRHSDVIK